MRSRLIPIAGFGLGAAALIWVIVSLSLGAKGPAPPIEGAGVVQRIYGGLEQQGPTLGDPDAPVSISIFNDLNCTECADYQLETVPPLVEDLVREGDARLEFRNRPVGLSPTTLAGLAATAAGEQGVEWQYAHLVFLNLDQARASGVNDEFLEHVAGSIPGPEFDVAQWRRDRDAAETEARVQSDDELGASLRVASPSVVVEGPGGMRELRAEPSVRQIEAAVRELG